jgi:molybdenum cofactor guanylyltransferase
MISVAILAGSERSRVGTLLNQPIIERVFAQVQGLGAETLLITNQPEAYAYLDLPLYADLFPSSGPLGGICTALHHTTCAHTLILSCDLPIISRDLLEHLTHLAPDFDIVVPQALGRLQPLHAVYSRACLRPALTCLRRGELTVNAFYQEMPRLHVVLETELQTYDPTAKPAFDLNAASHAPALSRRPWLKTTHPVKHRRRVGDRLKYLR